jgi:hypothetical protein
VTIVGSHYTDATSVLFNGLAASSFTVDSDNQARALVPPGASSGPITVENLVGGGTSASNFTVTAPPSNLTFSPVHDTYVRSDRAGNNYGGSSHIDIEEDAAQRRGYLKFDVTGVAGSVQSAKIRLLVTNAGNDGGGIYAVSNDYSTGGSWTEGSMIWDNAPLISGSPLSSTGAVSVADTIELDVTGAITGNGVYSFGIKNASTSRMEYSSKEGPLAAKMILDVLTTPVPVISSFNPASGGEGTVVTIIGSNLLTATGVFFNATPASFSMVSISEFTAVVPAGASSGKISVTNPDGTGESSSDFVVISPPVISTFSPPSGPVGTVVTISGVNLSNVRAVAFNGSASASVFIDSDTQVRAVVSTGATTGKIAVTNPAGTTESANPFSVTQIPVISSFNPTSGIVGDAVTINGQNFGGTTLVSFNGVSAAITSNTGSELVVSVPSGATTGKIEVTNGDGTGQSGSDFTVILPPVFSSFSPTSGAVGTEVTITGSNLAAVSSVKFNGMASATLHLDSDIQLRATVPTGASSGLIELTNDAGNVSSASPFTIAQIPLVSSFSPTSGVEGTVVTISGSNFTGTTGVTFGGQPGIFVFGSDSELTATVPAAATTSRIEVTNGDGTGESGSDFVVIVAPTISSFSPTSGPTGTEVTIIGSNCAQVTAVMFNGSAAASFNVDSDIQIKATVAAGASSGKISVENVAGTGVSGSDFTVTAPPSNLTFIPSHDAHVRSNRAASNYGGKSALQIEEDVAQRHGYLKFDVSGLVGAVQSAKLRLLVTNAGNDGGGIYPISNEYTTGGSWTEGGLTWNNAPSISGSPLSSVGAVAVGDVVEFDLTGAITGNGIYSFGIMNASKSRMEYSSKEGSQIPELIIEMLTSPVPVLSSFSPSGGIIGTEVTINGLNFGGTTSVTFNGKSASINSNTTSQLKVSVPSGAMPVISR